MLVPDGLGEDAVGDELADGEVGDAEDPAGLDTGETEDGAWVVLGHGREPERALGRDRRPPCRLWQRRSLTDGQSKLCSIEWHTS